MSFEECLNDCLDRLQRGESLEACLARYPEHADDLRGLLQAAQVLRASPPPLSVTAQSRGRERMHRAAEQQATKRWQLWPRRLALPLAAAIVAVFLVVVAGAARSSAPGDLAYPLRRFAETAALRLTADPIGRAAAPSGAGRAAAGRSAGTLAGGTGYRSWGVDGGCERNRRGARRVGSGNKRSQPGEIGPDRVGSRGL